MACAFCWNCEIATRSNAEGVGNVLSRQTVGHKKFSTLYEMTRNSFGSCAIATVENSTDIMKINERIRKNFGKKKRSQRAKPSDSVNLLVKMIAQGKRELTIYLSP